MYEWNCAMGQNRPYTDARLTGEMKFVIYLVADRAFNIPKLNVGDKSFSASWRENAPMPVDELIVDIIISRSRNIFYA